MTQAVFEKIQVAGMAAAVPAQREILMEKYNDIFGYGAVDAFSKTVGVLERRIAFSKQTSSDLAFAAASELIKNKAVKREEIGVLVFVTQTPDYRTPSTACVLHKRLGLGKDCIAFDVNLGCSGYVYGMQLICSLLRSTGSIYGLLLVGDTGSRAISPADRSAAMLFGDSASATLLEKQEDAESIRTVGWTDGSRFKTIIVPSGCYRNKDGDNQRTKWADGNERSDYDVYMNGIDVFSFSISDVPASINEFFNLSDKKKEDYDSYIFHQANCYILKQIIKKCKLDDDKVPISMDRYGNTSGASIPLTICDRYGDEMESKRLRLFTCGFGIGLSWGIAAFEINREDIYPIIETDEYYEDEIKGELR